MKWITKYYCFLLCFWLTGPSGLRAQQSVYVFLHDECLISQHYTVVLNELHEIYASDSLAIIGVFPNQRITELEIQVFKEKYQVAFELTRDENQLLRSAFNASVTPEVVVYDERQKTILYQGRIDNTYFRIGKKRRVTTTSELADVLAALEKKEAITTVSTKAVGCFIQLE